MTNILPKSLKGLAISMTLVIAAALLSWGHSSAYAVIDLSQSTNYNTNLNTSVDSSTDIDVDSNNIDADANVDAGAGIDVNSENNEGGDMEGSTNTNADSNTSGNGSVQFSAPNLSGEETLRIDRTNVNTEAEVNSTNSASVNTNDAVRASGSVQTVGDLRAYASSTVRSDEMVESMNFTRNSVEMRYKQKGKFLALIPVKFDVTARAKANGEVELNYPWYTFLTVDNKGEIETQLRVAVDNALRARTVGSVQAEGESENPFFTASEQAEIAAQMHTVLKSGFEGDGTVDN